ncbi:unnamed protein product [Cylindrotheca closterium]|uniref:Uncharacterized protein n=1 Tax=Cylindrotheca closterium TaxID=2856 RepID=A0AAD2PX04_9STRA|nr:unnamed protein product [Cylindrotheca closterium]
MIAWFVHFIISSLTIVTFHDAVILRHNAGDERLLPPIDTLSLCHMYPHLQTTKSVRVASFCFAYAIGLLVIRLASNKPGIHRYSVLYELTWLCNGALLFGGSFGLLTCRPNIATGFAVAVSIDQILWYVDVLGYAFNRLMGVKKKKMFPIGVCQYLVWKQTHWSAKITCTHHFWTIPLLIYAADGIRWQAYFMNTTTVASYVLLSRWLTPFGLNSHAKKIQDDKVTSREYNMSSPLQFEKYMNVNLSHELWQDIRIGILRRQADNQTTMVYLFRLIVWWQMFNLLCFLLLRGFAGMMQ